MKRLFHIIFLSVFFLPSAHAILIEHYKMDSFAYLSDAVILCEEVKIEFHETKYPSGFVSISSTVTCKVIETYKGNIERGESIALDFHSGFQRSKFLCDEKLPLGKTVVFLKKLEDGTHDVITAKLIQTSGIYMYRQSSNPGPLNLWPQETERINLAEGNSYDQAAFIEDLKLSVKASGDLKEAKPIWSFFSQGNTKLNGQQDGADQSDPARLSVSF